MINFFRVLFLCLFFSSISNPAFASTRCRGVFTQLFDKALGREKDLLGPHFKLKAYEGSEKTKEVPQNPWREVAQALSKISRKTLKFSPLRPKKQLFDSYLEGITTQSSLLERYALLVMTTLLNSKNKNIAETAENALSDFIFRIGIIVDDQSFRGGPFLALGAGVLGAAACEGLLLLASKKIDLFDHIGMHIALPLICGASIGTLTREGTRIVQYSTKKFNSRTIERLLLANLDNLQISELTLEKAAQELFHRMMVDGLSEPQNYDHFRRDILTLIEATGWTDTNITRILNAVAESLAHSIERNKRAHLEQVFSKIFSAESFTHMQFERGGANRFQELLGNAIETASR